MKLPCCVLSLFFIPRLIAIPSHPDVVQGDASFVHRSGGVLEIGSRGDVSIDWHSFSIEEGESVQFDLPSNECLALNRILGSEPSQIFGKLISNGKIVLWNPNGVLIGQSGIIDTASFTASAFPFEKRDEFWAGKIENKGAIYARSGEAVLAGTYVDHQGRLEAATSAALLAGKFLDLDDAPKSLVLQPKEQPSQILVGGSIRSRDIYVLANEIFFQTGSWLDSSGADGGGRIFAGGDYKGKGLASADSIFVNPGALFNADAIESGDGGRVIIWGSESNGFYGSITARGGASRGDGGFVETSSKGFLAVEGSVRTDAPMGRSGSWLIDPFTVTISTAVNSNVAPFGPPPPPPPAAGLFTMPLNAMSPAVCNVNNVMLGTALGTNSVLIDADDGCNIGLGGTIAVAALGNVVWGSANTLTLSARNGITINANIQNDGTGGVVLLSNSFVSIDATPAAVGVSAGSRFGLTQVTSCDGLAPFPSLTIQGGNGADDYAQLGYFTPDNMASNGPIQVDCAALDILGGSSTRAGAQLGHGQINLQTLGVGVATTAGADIFVNARGDVHLQSGTGANASSLLGHGAFQFRNTAAFNSQAGDITVISSGNITLDTAPGVTGTQAGAFIGHGGYLPEPGAPLNGIDSIIGNIRVEACGNITFQSTNAQLNRVGISHHYHQNTASSFITTCIGDIDVRCGGNLTAFCNNPNTSHFFLGHQAVEGFITLTENIRVVVGGDITVRMGGDSQGAIGWSRFGAQLYEPLMTGYVAVIAGGNLTLQTQNNSAGDRDIVIGFMATEGVGPPNAADNVATYVAVGGNILLQGQNFAGPGYDIGITGYGNVNVAAQGNITVNGDSSSALDFVSIGTNRYRLPAAPVSRVYAKGTILANSVAGAGPAFIGEGLNTPTGVLNFSVDARAGGDLQLSQDFTTDNAGTVNLEADAPFASGQLWAYTGSNITSICGETINPSIDPRFSLAPCQSPLTGTIPSATSTSQSCDGRGAFFPQAGLGNIAYTTTAGDISINSSDARTNGAAQNLVIGTGANEIAIVTTSGNIDVAGCGCLRAFQDVVISSVATPWTAGNVSVRASRNLTVNDAVAVSGANSTISLFSDCNLAGGGNVDINASITAVDGLILIDAGVSSVYGGPACLSGFPCGSGLNTTAASINLNAGTVSTAGGGIQLQAQNDIHINGAAVSISSMTGFIHTIAGNDTIISQGVENTALGGDLLFISGNSMFVNGAPLSTPNPLTLVVDNNFPAPPLMGTTGISIDAASVLTGAPLRIFTSQEPYNFIFGSLNSQSFAAGTPFQDTLTEQWCSYFNCGFPYPFADLGDPFTVFYKPCLQQLTAQAMVIVDEFLVALHPYNEFPGWVSNFWIEYRLAMRPSDEPFYLRRRALNLLNHPKSYSQLTGSLFPYETVSD